MVSFIIESFRRNVCDMRIYDMVTDRFLGVNLNEDYIIEIIRNKKNCSREKAEIRVKHDI